MVFLKPLVNEYALPVKAEEKTNMFGGLFTSELEMKPKRLKVWRKTKGAIFGGQPYSQMTQSAEICSLGT